MLHLIDSELEGNPISEPEDYYKPDKNTVTVKDSEIPEPDIKFIPDPVFPNEHVGYEELIQAYLDCRRHKAKTHNAVVYEMNLFKNIEQLKYELNSGSYLVSRSICFLVYEPKPREIFAALFKDRIVHHLFVNRVLELFEDWVWIRDSYSCRKNKGTLYGINRLITQLQDITEEYKYKAWVLKLDLTGCFVSVPKDRLYNFISQILEIIYKGQVKRGVWTKEYAESKLNFDLWILYKIVYNRPQNGCVFKTAKRAWEFIPDNKSLLKVPNNKNQGMPVGNITSQILVNVFLTILDMFCRFVLAYDGINGGYGRYVDDAYFISLDKKRLMKTIGWVTRFVKRHLDMSISKNKIYLQPVDKGVSFTGSYAKPRHTYSLYRNLHNFICFFHIVSKNRQKLIAAGVLPDYFEIIYMIQCCNSRLGHLVHNNSYNFRKRLLLKNIEKYPDHWSGYFRIYKSPKISYNKLVINPFYYNQYLKWMTA